MEGKKQKNLVYNWSEGVQDCQFIEKKSINKPSKDMLKSFTFEIDQLAIAEVKTVQLYTTTGFYINRQLF